MDDFIEAAGCLLITKSEPWTCLLMKHVDRWDLPKGHRDHGEELLQTALRETYEETGISPDKIEIESGFQFNLTYAVRRKGEPKTKSVTYFLGFIEQQHEIELSEHIGYQWFPWPPPGPIQTQTIDPLMAAVQRYLAGKSG